MHDLPFFQNLIEQEIQKIKFGDQPAELYDPIRYMLKLGGKRIRPSLLLMSCEMFGGHYKDAFAQALGVEVFHNFTLLHDDIMDKAPLRRAKATVYSKWNSDVAILSGDAMFVKACQLMISVESGLWTVSIGRLFLETALLVCEGQQWDMTFQNDDEVTIAQYLKMIELKTAVLIACSLKIGAIIGGALEADQNLIYDFGKNLGIAFQLHDDTLDLYGDEKKFGKQQGGDIIANKKTFLLLKARELATVRLLEELNDWSSTKAAVDSISKIAAIKNIYEILGVKALAEEEMNNYFSKAISSLENIRLPSEKKIVLKNLAQSLMRREY
jgi:geranylgeranyl diphosphate synthase type II